MDGYPKIGVKNVAVVNICFRMADVLYNDGRIILDIDTYDFAGHLANDTILGFFDNGRYHIEYYYIQYDFESDPQMGPIGVAEIDYEEYKIEMEIAFQKVKLPNDFDGVMLSFSEEGITITLDGFEPNMEIIQRCLEENADLIEQRY